MYIKVIQTHLAPVGLGLANAAAVNPKEGFLLARLLPHVKPNQTKPKQACCHMLNQTKPNQIKPVATC